MGLKNFIEFIFPELQVFDAIQKYGFLQMPREKGVTAPDQPENQRETEGITQEGHTGSDTISKPERSQETIMEDENKNMDTANDDALDETTAPPVTEDVKTERKRDISYDLNRELANIIGQEEIKEYIRSLSARLRLQKERKKHGLIVDSSQTLHMIFMGNPGTGKTMIARILAEVFYQIGILPTNKLVETDRSGLIAGYVGQTAIKTREKIMEALDGVLFIDEAYSLAVGGENDFGDEAINTLVKFMEDYRDRLIVVLAGYRENMELFLASNPGLRSRFPNILEFNDYSEQELLQIFDLQCEKQGYILEPQARELLLAVFSRAKTESQFGNGRYVWNVFERALNNQALRLNSDMELTKEELMTIMESDIEPV